jgi:hypothetical protein
MLEVYNNLMWLPTIINVPTFLALHTPVRGGGLLAATVAQNGAGGGGAGGITGSCNAGPQIHNPNRDTRFMGSTPLKHTMHIRGISVAIATDGHHPPEVIRNGTRFSLCVS